MMVHVLRIYLSYDVSVKAVIYHDAACQESKGVL